MFSGWTAPHWLSVIGAGLGTVVAAKTAVIPLLPLLGPAAPFVGLGLAVVSAVYGVLQEPPR